MTLYEGVNPYAARPGVDLETEGEGEALRNAIWDLFEHHDGYGPADIRAMFNELLTDIAIDHGWFRDPDGKWYMPVLYKVPS